MKENNGISILIQLGCNKTHKFKKQTLRTGDVLQMLRIDVEVAGILHVLHYAKRATKQ
jgi:hypothetical protein